MSKKDLVVFIHLQDKCVPAGLLNITESNTEVIASNFKYGLKYLDRPGAIAVDPEALSIDKLEAVRGIELMPSEGMTFFGGIRDAAPDAWGRRIIEAKLKAPLNGLPESAYLLESGNQRMGALDIRASIDAPPKLSKNSIHRLEYLMEAAERIEEGLPIPAQLEDIFQAGSQLGGMRPKACVEDDEGVLWLAKFRSRGEVVDVPWAEVATLKLAHDAGLNVPEVKVEKFGTKTAMLIKRFDRDLVDNIQHRHHMVSALTMLKCHEMDSRTKSYADIANAIRKHGHKDDIKKDTSELFGRMVFNILVGNDDDHLRNHAFLWDFTKKSWQLSPLYDVMPRPTLATERFLHIGAGSQGRLATIDNALSEYSRFNLTKEDAIGIVDRIWSVVREWKTRFEGYGVQGSTIEQISLAFRHIDGLVSPDTIKKIRARKFA